MLDAVADLAGFYASRDGRPVPRPSRARALSELFGEVLALCAKGGLVSVGVIAVDGTEVHTNASNHANRDFEQLAREILDEADAADRPAVRRASRRRAAT